MIFLSFSICFSPILWPSCSEHMNSIKDVICSWGPVVTSDSDHHPKHFKNISITLVPISCDQSCPGVRNRISWTVLYKFQMACQAINKQGLMAECKMFHQIPVVSMSVYATGYRPMTPVKPSKHASFLAVFDGPVPLKARPATLAPRNLNCQCSWNTLGKSFAGAA